MQFKKTPLATIATRSKRVLEPAATGIKYTHTFPAFRLRALLHRDTQKLSVRLQQRTKFYTITTRINIKAVLIKNKIYLQLIYTTYLTHNYRTMFNQLLTNFHYYKR